MILLMRTILHYYIPRYAMQDTVPVGEVAATEEVEGAGGENVADLRCSLRVFINAENGEDDVIADLQEVDVCPVVIGIW